MLQLLNPIWLFATVALAVPILVHLWNIRPAKALKIGSIALIKEISSKTVRSFKLSDLLLLALRCLLIIMLAALLSEPLWRKENQQQTAKGWILIESDQVKEAYSKFKFAVDSAIKAGYEFHYFEPGFAKANIRDALTDTLKKNRKDVVQSSYWSLLNALNMQIPAGLPVLLITDNRVSRFTGHRPTTSHPLNWKVYAAADSNKTWLHNAYFTTDGSIQAVVAKSNPAGTIYNFETVDPATNNSEYQVSLDRAKPVIGLKKGGANISEMPIDTATIRIAVFTDKYRNDANYLKAAIDAIRKFTKRKIDAEITGNENFQGRDWMFWLSDKPMKQLSPQIKTLRYIPGKVALIDSWVEYGQYPAMPKVELSKRISISNRSENIIWKDGFGNALLEKENETFNFYSHFDPAWNGLVWHDEFPKLLYDLIIGESVEPISGANDRRAIDRLQLLPEFNRSGKKSAPGYEDTPLQHIFWGMLFATFLAERWLSDKQRSLKHG